VDELSELLSEGFDTVSATLMAVRGKTSVKIEHDLGLFTWNGISMPPTGTTGSSLEVTQNDGPHITLSTAHEIGAHMLCGAMYVKDKEGIPLARHTWDRVTNVVLGVRGLAHLVPRSR
jgi:hypothetical protein